MSKQIFQTPRPIFKTLSKTSIMVSNLMKLMRVRSNHITLQGEQVWLRVQSALPQTRPKKQNIDLVRAIL